MRTGGEEMKPDTNSSQRRVIPASEILEKIARGEPVEYDDVIVEGDLDLRGLDLLTEHVERTEFEIEVLVEDFVEPRIDIIFDISSKGRHTSHSIKATLIPDFRVNKI